MKIITNQPKNFEMVWATRISTNNLTDMHQWKFESQTRNVQTRIQIISATVMDWRRGEASC